MSMNEQRPPVAPGEPAPFFALPAVPGPGTVSLDDYRGSNGLLLTLLVGLWCPFCRREIVRLGALDDKLKALGVQTLSVIATDAQNAQLYFKFRPTKLKLASDPLLTTHRAYGVPKPEPTPQMLEAVSALRINPNGELPEPLPVQQAADALAKLDGYQPNTTDQQDVERQWPQLKGQFLIDRDGIVRWSYIECQNGLASLGEMPSEDTILEAARTLAH
jgi:peroxiredoxin